MIKITPSEILDLISKISDKSFKELLGDVVLFLVKNTNSDIGSAYVVDEKNRKFDIVAVVEKSQNTYIFKEVKDSYLGIEEGIVGWVYRNRTIYISDDNIADKYYKPLLKETSSEITAPVVCKNKVIAILNLENSKKENYSKEDIETLNTVATLLSPILSKLIEQRKEFLDKIYYKVLSEIRAISQEIRDLEKTYRLIMNILVSEIDIHRGMILIVENNSKTLNIKVSYGFPESKVRNTTYKIGEGIVGEVAKTSKAISIPNIWEEKRFLNKTQVKRDRSKIISFFANPIVFSDKLIGVITIEKEYTDEHEFSMLEKLMASISDTIALNVMHYLVRENERKKLLQENEELKTKLYEKYSVNQIVGISSKMLEVFKMIDTISNTDSTVLILGESGTGKELVAKSIHYNSPRKSGPFVSLNCAAIPESLLESELFGYKKGAFTGATSDKKGKIELADGGTLFLDEIGDLALPLQAKLLRTLQEKEVEPIGGQPFKVDVRIIAATNKNLEELVKNGLFRLDLFYRINVITIELPPLRERKEDIPILVEKFVEKFSKKHSKPIKKIHKSFIDSLINYHWPGNVRELENTIERCVILSEEGELSVELLPNHIRQNLEPPAQYINIIQEYIKQKVSTENDNLYGKIISPIEEMLIKEVLDKTSYNKLKASKILGINRNTLSAYIKKYNI